MNLSISNIAWNGAKDEEVFALMHKYGFAALEVAPTKIIASEPYKHLSEAARWAQDVRKKYGFGISSMQSIWYGRTEKLFGTEDERAFLLEYTKGAIDFANAIGAKNLVFGCPKNRNRPDGADTNIAVRFFREAGDYAAAKNTCIGMEANPAIYGTNFVNTTADAFALVEEVASKGFRLNLDIGTMIEGGESAEILRGRVRLINHLHISEPYLKRIEARTLHNEVISLLRAEGYDKFISIEMSEQKDISNIESVMRYVYEIASN